MVEFNGVSMLDVAPVKIIDIYNTSPEVLPVSQTRALQDGALFVRRTRGVRDITVTFVIMEADAAQRRAYLSALIAWAASPTLAPLKIMQEPLGYLNAICTDYPDQSSREYWEVLQMQFTAYDPAFTAVEEYRQPITLPVYVSRSEPPLMRIEQAISTPLSAPAWSLGAQSLSIVGDVGVGALIIDFDAETITLNGASIMSQLAIGSTFFALQQGANQITLANGAGGTLCWRERWL